MKALLLIIFTLNISFVFAQSSMQESDQLPYRVIPEAPSEYNDVNVAARMLDGLGFRYYWATEGLREEDLTFKPSEEARTSLETMMHIYALVDVVLNATKNEPNVRPKKYKEYDFNEMRYHTLNMIKEASDILKAANAGDLESMSVVFQRESGESTFPYWNLINGPIADAIWHVGQVVTFRRSSGNPVNSNISFMRGKERQ